MIFVTTFNIEDKLFLFFRNHLLILSKRYIYHFLFLLNLFIYLFIIYDKLKQLNEQDFIYVVISFLFQNKWFSIF